MNSYFNHMIGGCTAGTIAATCILVGLGCDIRASIGMIVGLLSAWVMAAISAHVPEVAKPIKPINFDDWS